MERGRRVIPGRERWQQNALIFGEHAGAARRYCAEGCQCAVYQLTELCVSFVCHRGALNFAQPDLPFT